MKLNEHTFPSLMKRLISTTGPKQKSYPPREERKAVGMRAPTSVRKAIEALECTVSTLSLGPEKQKTGERSPTCFLAGQRKEKPCILPKQLTPTDEPMPTEPELPHAFSHRGFWAGCTENKISAPTRWVAFPLLIPLSLCLNRWRKRTFFRI